MSTTEASERRNSTDVTKPIKRRGLIAPSLGRYVGPGYSGKRRARSRRRRVCSPKMSQAAAMFRTPQAGQRPSSRYWLFLDVSDPYGSRFPRELNGGSPGLVAWSLGVSCPALWCLGPSGTGSRCIGWRAWRGSDCSWKRGSGPKRQHGTRHGRGRPGRKRRRHRRARPDRGDQLVQRYCRIRPEQLVVCRSRSRCRRIRRLWNSPRRATVSSAPRQRRAAQPSSGQQTASQVRLPVPSTGP